MRDAEKRVRSGHPCNREWIGSWKTPKRCMYGGRYRTRTYDFHRVKVATYFVIRELRGMLGSARECSGAYFSTRPRKMDPQVDPRETGLAPSFLSTRFARLARWFRGPEPLSQAASFPPSVPFSSVNLPSFLQHIGNNRRRKPDCLTQRRNRIFEFSQSQMLSHKCVKQQPCSS